MRAQDRRTGRGLAVRYVLLVLLGALKRHYLENEGMLEERT